ncbi:hypothetical protein GALMADRAFT_162140 [Galerina marginata CBS 339.88]|uniref:MYND-type domain-containing protein n=1 Tax=Galerina marginata (strain CBS 339.88) TaxID=685588 RepID=A0A067SI13_GALM3|nr:hypothetical protein GALMADRAFT_162140 [Galerina marginata CBS 339.88]
MRFRIETRPLDSPFQTIEGSWTPLSTSDLGSVWNGSEHWVRCQGAEFTKAIWFHNHFDRPDLSVSWSGMSAAENLALSTWMKERREAIDERESKVTAEYEERKTQFGDKFHPEEDRLARLTSYKRRTACRADCGVENPTFTCSKCKMTRYCSLACQSDDWKYHKTYCGTEPPIPTEF